MPVNHANIVPDWGGIQLKIDSLRNDFTNGSGVIARNAIQILRDASLVFPEKEQNKYLKSVAGQLLEAKPGMAATVNFMKVCLAKLENFTSAGSFLQFLSNLETRIEKASYICVNSGLRELPLSDGISFITCSFSSVVFNIAHQSKTKLKVLVLQSQWKDMDYGRIFYDRLRETGINSEYLALTDVYDKTFGFALVGADAILRNGSVINGKPSLELAERVKLKGIPLYVAGESFKKCINIPLCEGFDLLPGKLIKKIITDDVF